MTYSTAPIDTSDAGLSALRALLKIVWPEQRRFTLDYLRWLYADNPSGAAVGFNAFHDGVMVAHYATIPIEADLEGGASRGLLSLNTATHPEHQGKGLFTRLANETYELAVAGGFAFVVGVANANSTAGFTRKLGFDLVSPLDARLGIGTLPAARTHASVAFMRRWSPELLAWRLRPPEHGYVRSFDQATNCHLLSASSGYPLIRAALARVPDNEGVSTVVSSLPMAAKRPWVWIGLDPDWGHSLSTQIPSALRPSPLNLIFKTLGGRSLRLERSAVKFEAIDFDAY